MRLLTAFSASHHSDETSFDSAPILDFVLSLLIFCSITAVFIKEAGITVSGLNVATAERKEAGNVLIATRDGSQIWLDNRVVNIRERLHAQHPNDVVVAEKDARTSLPM